MIKISLKLFFLEARDLPDAWFQCVYNIFDYGQEYTIDRGSYKGQKRLEFDYVTIQIKHPNVRPLAPDMPPGMGLPPPTDEQTIENYFVDYIMSGFKQPNEDYTYTERLRNPVFRFKKEMIEKVLGYELKKPKNLKRHERDNKHSKGYHLEIATNIDLVKEVIRMYKEDGFGTNQAIMEIAMPTDIMLNDPPCLRSIDTRIRYGKLHFMAYFRSWDLWGGLPVNLGGLQLLKEYMALEIGVEDGDLIAASKGLHLYDDVWELAKLRTYKEGKNKLKEHDKL